MYIHAYEYACPDPLQVFPFLDACAERGAVSRLCVYVHM